MSVRTFVFCDICNPQGFRCPEHRRDVRRGDQDGRRLSDARTWFEGDPDTAIAEHGWIKDAEGRHVCPECVHQGRHLQYPPLQEPATTRRFVFCDLCNPEGVRNLELRRDGARGDRQGRRVTDGRAWYEGNSRDAVAKAGWLITSEGQHVCPDCIERHDLLRLN